MSRMGVAETALLALSLFNAVLYGWLGLTVLLSAGRRVRSLLIPGGAMVAAGLFFLGQTVVLVEGLGPALLILFIRWKVGWLTGLALPLAWYATMLWHAGFWSGRRSGLRRRHTGPAVVAGAFAAAGAGLVMAAEPDPMGAGAGFFGAFTRPALGGVPLLSVAFPACIVLCMALALDVLRRPEPSPHLMADEARRRARPWLVACSVVLLVVSILVGLLMVTGGRTVIDRQWEDWPGRLRISIVRADLGLSALIAVACLLLGQAVVAYEVFSGKALPRGSLRRQWHGAVALAAGYGGLMAWTLSVAGTAPYVVVQATVLITVAFALASWRSYVERDRTIAHLRPFVTSPRLYDALLAGGDADPALPFRALCTDILDTEVAYLIPVGPLASLAGPPLVHPAGGAPPDVSELVVRVTAPEPAALPLGPARYGGARWAIPLWSDRGLSGLLLLGPKATGSLYTQEEIEIARATGERLLDTVATARMAQRLMELQRQRLAATQVADQRTRRRLHDDVLPRLHAAMLALNAGDDRQQVVAELGVLHRDLAALVREMPGTAAPEVGEGVGLVGALRRLVQEEYAGAFDGVTWDVDPQAQERADALPPIASEVLFGAAREAVRNAARHGRGLEPSRPLRLHLTLRRRAGLELVVEDDGVGLAARSEGAPAGQGVALHSTLMAVIGGAWSAESAPGRFTRVTLSLPHP